MAARYKVDPARCIGCGLCRERAPENIDLSPGDASAVVFKQPENEEEEESCREASDYCPTAGLEQVRMMPVIARSAPAEESDPEVQRG